MATRTPSRKKYFTPQQANAMLPLVRQIVGDIAELARGLRDRHQRLVRIGEGESTPAHAEEADQIEVELEQGQSRMAELERELRSLGILMKDYFIGLIDFPHWLDDREVYLCWKLGEPTVAHWHEIDAGFSGRQKLLTEARVSGE
jgi:hypothetical protein